MPRPILQMEKLRLQVLHPLSHGELVEGWG